MHMQLISIAHDFKRLSKLELQSNFSEIYQLIVSLFAFISLFFCAESQT